MPPILPPCEGFLRPGQVRLRRRSRRAARAGCLPGRLPGSVGCRRPRRLHHRTCVAGPAELVPRRHRRPDDPAAGPAGHGRAGRLVRHRGRRQPRRGRVPAPTPWPASSPRPRPPEPTAHHDLPPTPALGHAVSPGSEGVTVVSVDKPHVREHVGPPCSQRPACTSRSGSRTRAEDLGAVAHRARRGDRRGLRRIGPPCRPAPVTRRARGRPPPPGRRRRPGPAHST